MRIPLARTSFFVSIIILCPRSGTSSGGCSSASAASPCGASCVGSLPLPGCSALFLCARGPATWPGGFAFLRRGSSHGLNWWPCSVREQAAGTNTGCRQTRTVVVRNKCEHKEDVKIISII
ncbi:hypothetical protein B0H10DRAFT_1976003 [Mycena sp. CBHHK59/15]|nr:hypothetical protein B0H10DRAFT_1976003 [Mycena sp. CBHHK59/15]